MRRWVLVFLLLVLPFQLIWASAAPYCAHESGASAKTANSHFGHHEHRHQSGAEVGSDTQDASDGMGAFDADCGSCHLSCSAFMPAAIVAVDAVPHGDAAKQPEPLYDSHIPASPLRPDRAHATPAARFGGDVVVDSFAD